MKVNHIIKREKDIPSVSYQENTLLMEGVCMPENAADMFKTISENLESIDKDELKIKLNFKYLNSMSSKQLLRLLFTSVDKFKEFEVVWSYAKEDELMKMKGEELQEILEDVKFEINSLG